MTAFDTAWDLLKMPYHGTGTIAAKKIMQEGLTPDAHPFFDNHPDFPNQPYVSWATRNPKNAGGYAQRYENETDEKDRPAIIHISNEMPILYEEESPFESIVAYGGIVPPEMMEVAYEGRSRHEGESDEDYHKYVSNDILEWLASREEKQ